MSITQNEERSYAHAVPSNTFSITKRSSDDLNVSIENIFQTRSYWNNPRNIPLQKEGWGLLPDYIFQDQFSSFKGLYCSSKRIRLKVNYYVDTAETLYFTYFYIKYIYNIE